MSIQQQKGCPSVCRRGRWSRLSATVVLGLAATRPACASPSVYPTGVTVYDPAQAYNCDVLFSATDHKTYLIDMNGNVVRHWNMDGFPSKVVDPSLVNGAKGIIGLQVAPMSEPEALASGGASGIVPGAPAQFRNKSFGFVDWNGAVLWQWGETAPHGAALQHHDWARLPNGDTLILSNEAHQLPGFGDRKMIEEPIYEVDPTGKIVWTWLASQHLDELGFTPAQLDLVRHSPEADYLHINAMAVLGPNHWAEAGDTRFAPGNIMISSRDANLTIIIDRETGGVVWRLGPDYRPRGYEYKPENTSRPVDQISGQHDPHLIPEGLPGAGNLLVFDNQGEAGFPPVKLQVIGGSRVLEINPATMEIVWEHTGYDSSQANWSFFCPFISSAQRLPNGNTLIDEGIDGRSFQVTRDGKIVWEYVSPFIGAAPLIPLPLHAEAKSNWVYRAQAVPYDWVPDAPHSEVPVRAPSLAGFHVPP